MEHAPIEPLDLRPLVRADDVAAACDVSGRFIHLLASRGEIPCLRLGRRAVRFVPGDVEQALGLPPGIIRRMERRRKW